MKQKSLKCNDDVTHAVTDDNVSLGVIVQLKRDNWKDEENCENALRKKLIVARN